MPISLFKLGILEKSKISKSLFVVIVFRLLCWEQIWNTLWFINNHKRILFSKTGINYAEYSTILKLNTLKKIYLIRILICIVNLKIFFKLFCPGLNKWDMVLNQLNSTFKSKVKHWLILFNRRKTESQFPSCKSCRIRGIKETAKVNIRLLGMKEDSLGKSRLFQGNVDEGLKQIQLVEVWEGRICCKLFTDLCALSLQTGSLKDAYECKSLTIHLFNYLILLWTVKLLFGIYKCIPWMAKNRCFLKWISTVHHLCATLWLFRLCIIFFQYPKSFHFLV